MEENITYFENQGEENTSKTLALALDRADKRNIDKIVLASTRGNTAEALMEMLKDKAIQLIVVPWQYGFKQAGNPFPQEQVQKIRSQGHAVHFGTMLFHTDHLYGNNTPQALANLLRIFGQGIKVVVEIVMMTCDGGLIEQGEKVVVISGTHTGADTAVVATAATSNRIPSLKINEIICKPLL